jgi:hypothetical protein
LADTQKKTVNTKITATFFINRVLQ